MKTQELLDPKAALEFPQRGKLRTEGGRGLVEYALILLLVVVVAGLRVFGSELFGSYNQIEARLFF